MMRPVRTQVIWLHGSYRFESRDEMYAAIVAARRLLDNSSARAPLSLHTSVLGNELAVIVRLPMFEETEASSELFGLLARTARTSALEARVDVL